MLARPVQRTTGLRMLDGLVTDLQAVRNHIAVLQAAEAELFARAVIVIEAREDERSPKATRAIANGAQIAVREVHAELAAALRLSEYTIARKIDQGYTLNEKFTDTMMELVLGHIDGAHADAIVDVGAVLADDGLRAQFEAMALEWAKTETPTRLRGLLSDLITRLDPDGTEERVQDAVSRRRTWVRDVEPGVSCLGITGPTALIHGAHDRLTQIAADLRNDNAAAERAAGEDSEGYEPVDDRTLGQIRTDVAIDMLLTGAPTGHGGDDSRTRFAELRGVVHIEIPAMSLTGEQRGGATIPNHGPVDIDTARLLAADAPTWSRVFRDPETRVPTCVDTYRPSKKQRRLLKARDVRCRFPGCRRPARGTDRNADIDHTIAWADGGPTALWNLAHLCRRHHTLKHETDWTVEQLPGGLLRWTAPTRRVHHDRPPGTVMFVPSDDLVDAAPF